MYRNLHYDWQTSVITCWAWDEDGNRVERREKFHPYLYLETKDTKYDAISIFNTKLKKIEFNSEASRRKFVDRSMRRMFMNIPVKQQYLLEKYADVPTEKMVENPLRIFYLDIETYSHDTFPDPEIADWPITAITIFDTLTEKFYTWGLEKDYKDPSGLKDIGVDTSSVVYVKCKNEVELMELFVSFWSRNYPDVITGWNSSTYDIPYIINRGNKLLGNNRISDLSPVGALYSRLRQNIFDRYYDHWVIDGVSDIDYLELYEKSEMNQHESYKLGYIGNLEGVDGKVEFESANLATLADEDWDKYITYNIQDVNIMVKLEAKKRYLRVARGKSYRGFATLDKALDSVPIVTGMIAKAGLDRNQMVVTFKPSDNASEKFEGGHVFKPSGKMHNGIVSFDVNSLYPNTMITLNTSPETKVGKVSFIDESTVRLTAVSGKSKIITRDQLSDLIKTHNLILTKANILFSQKEMGLCPQFLDDMYQERIRIKAAMVTETDPDKKEQMDIEQYLLKILLNSVYGVFGNKYFGLFDLDIATSVTLTGQAMIKKSTEIVQDYTKEKCGITDNVVVYGDTDSNFFDFDKILRAMKVQFFREKDGELKVSEEAFEVIDEFEGVLNDRINAWAKEELYTKDPRYHFSREKICFKGTFLTKKNYILRVVNNEGEECDKITAKGVELVKSSHSQPVKDIIWEVINCIFYDRGKASSNDVYLEGLEKFKKLSPADIAKRQGAKDHEKWSSMANGMNIPKGSGTPVHHKGAIFYNQLLKDLKLEGKYPKISTGQKIKFLYVKKNGWGIDVISFVDELPVEFGLEPDYDLQFRKMITPLIQRCYTGSGWILPDPDKLPAFDLFDFLGLDEN